MKPSLIAASLALLLTPALQAQDLHLTKPILVAKAPAKVGQFDRATKSRIEVDGFAYAFFIYLKNTSDKPLTVVTDSLSLQSAPGEARQNVVLDMNKMTLANDGALIVPSREDLRLVELRPGEAAGLKVELKTSVPLEEISVTYRPEDFYDGRFGYWAGKVVSEPLKIETKQKDNAMP